MRKINPKSSDQDSFKYSILISLHHYDVTFHPERVSELKLFENKYNFHHINPNEFEINNANVSITVFDENDKILYMPNNNSINKARIVKLKDGRYVAMKPLKNRIVKLNKILETFSHIELKEYIAQNILNKIEAIKLKT